MPVLHRSPLASLDSMPRAGARAEVVGLRPLELHTRVQELAQQNERLVVSIAGDKLRD